MRNHKKLKCMLSLCLVLVCLLSTQKMHKVLADDLPYDSYNYDYREYIHFTPAAYVPNQVIRLTDLTYQGESIGKFTSPQDLCKSPSGNIYVADTGNNRIIVLDSTMKTVVKVIESFDNNGKTEKFNQPSGVCVSEKGNLYICDTKNRRVVVLDEEEKLIQLIQNPTSESLDDTYVFSPLKVIVDYADRAYIIAQNMFEGIMVFESDGQFTNFFGTINVEISPWDKFWSRIATKEERSKQQLYIPTEFTGIDIDPEGFVYATNIDAKGEQGVRRLNPKGEDVIKKGENKNLGGDLWIDGMTEYSGASQFTDIVYRENGIYSCLDRKRGRVFTYDHEGNMLYIFGGLGIQEGTFTMPVAIEQTGDCLAVLDATRGSILLFHATEYGKLINEAVGLRYDGDEAEAVSLWKRVLELDENNELANSGIGKAYLTAGDYPQAMKYLKLGMDRDYYSIAYRRYRNAILAENIGYFLTGALVLIVVLLVWKGIKKRRGEQNE